jgi:plastocyanin
MFPGLPSARLIALGFAAGLLALSLEPGRAAEPGRIVGHVRLGLKAAARPLSTASYGWQITSPAAPASEMTNVLVWLKHPAVGDPPAPMRAELRQRGETFVPHTIAVTVGSIVSFPNADPLFHNVFALSRAGTFDLGRYPRGDSRQRQMTRPGIVKVYCHLHSHMNAIVAVFDHPWFAQVAADGTFAIERVPPGEHVLVGWHERAGNTERTISVDPGGTSRVDLLVPLDLDPRDTQP